jgi:quinol-cytochrome oxidoreductase complex cytochrome b subunit
MLLLLLLLLVAMFQGQRHTRAAAPKVQGNGPEGKAGRHKIYPSHISSAPALVLVLIVVHIISFHATSPLQPPRMFSHEHQKLQEQKQRANSSRIVLPATCCIDLWLQ